VLAIGWSAIFVRWAHVSGPASAFYRALTATLVLVPWRLARGGHASRRTVALAALGGVFFAFDLALFNSAVLSTSAANATLLGNNAPLMVGLGAWLVFGQRPAHRFWIGLVLALVGTVTIAGADTLRHATFGLGDVMAVLASVFFAGYILSTNRVRAHADTLTVTTVAVASSATTLLVVCLVLRLPLGGYPAQSWVALAALGLVTQLVGYLCVTYALGRLPATATSVGLLGQAPITALLAVPFLGETLSAAQVVGGALVLAGIYVVVSAA
jgi:drug/metabolite transporter (DMT)-like permease